MDKLCWWFINLWLFYWSLCNLASMLKWRVFSLHFLLISGSTWALIAAFLILVFYSLYEFHYRTFPLGPHLSLVMRVSHSLSNEVIFCDYFRSTWHGRVLLCTCVWFCRFPLCHYWPSCLFSFFLLWWQSVAKANSPQWIPIQLQAMSVWVSFCSPKVTCFKVVTCAVFTCDAGEVSESLHMISAN